MARHYLSSLVKHISLHRDWQCVNFEGMQVRAWTYRRQTEVTVAPSYDVILHLQRLL